MRGAAVFAADQILDQVALLGEDVALGQPSGRTGTAMVMPVRPVAESMCGSHHA